MPLMPVARFACALLLLVALTLGGCGQKGPLTLTAPQSADAPASEPQAGEESPEQEEEPSGDDC